MLNIRNDAAEQSAFARTLESIGLLVDTATNGHEGLAFFYESKCDLVIAGAQMRPTSGFDIAQTIKPSAPEIPIAISVEPADFRSAESLPTHL